MMNQSVRYGLILGLISVLISVVTLFTFGPETLLSTPFSIGNMLLFMGLTVYFALEIRKSNGGFFTFGEAFKTTFIICAVIVIIGNIYTYLLYNFIEPSLAELTMDKAIETSESMMSAMGADQEAVDKALESIKAEDFEMGPAKILQGMLFGFGLYAVFSLIVAAIIKRSNPEEEM